MIKLEQEHKGILHIIHTKVAPRGSSSPMKLALLQTLLKIVKRIQVWREREFKCGVCGVRAPPLYLYMSEVGLGVYKLGNHLAPSLHAAMQSPEQGWAKPC